MTEDLPDDIEAIATGVDPVVWIVIGVVVVAIIAGIVIAALRRRRRTARYEERFGREYQRTIDRAGSRSDAERELDERAERRRRFTLRPLSAGRRDELRTRWDHLQSDFVEAPASTVRNAEVLLDEAARERGYPDADAEQRLRDLALDHSDEVHAYREASGTLDRNADGSGGDDEGSLRRRMVAGRELFEALLESGRATTDPGTAGGTRDSDATRTDTDGSGATAAGATASGANASADDGQPRRSVADGDEGGSDRLADQPPRAETRSIPGDRDPGQTRG